jgi:putative membrane protein
MDRDTDKNKHHGLQQLGDKIQDAAAAAVGRTGAAMAGGSSAGFVENAAISDLYEIAAGEIALRRSRSDAVRRIAEAMIQDHATSSDQLRAAVLGHVHVPLPLEMDDRRRGMIENLESAPDNAFDKTYLDQQTAAHQEAITLFKSYRDRGDEDLLLAHVHATLPNLERHLEMVRAAKD